MVGTISTDNCPDCGVPLYCYHETSCPRNSPPSQVFTGSSLSETKSSVREDILEKAGQAVLKDRQNTYGDLEDSFVHTAALWSIHLGHEVTPTDVPILLALLKIARLKSSPQHLDNWVDIAGYAACGGEIATREK